MKRKVPLRSPWPLGIVVGLGIVFVANGIMITLAVQNPSAPAAKDHYQESARHDEVLAERAAAEALGWSVSVQTCPTGHGPAGCTTSMTVTDAQGQPVDGLSGTIRAQRADSARFDRSGALEPVGPGRYRTSLDLAAGGLYRLEIRLAGGPAPWVGTREAWIRSEGEHS